MAGTTFSYNTVSIRDFRANLVPDEKDPKREKVNTIEVGGRTLKPTNRFWTSFSAKYGFSPSIFKWFDHHEVFSRISERQGSDDRIRIAIEEDPTKAHGQLLAATSPSRPLISHEILLEVLDDDEYQTQNIAYDDGIVTSTHKVGHAADFNLFGDTFSHTFTLSTPIDGYGMPSIYLSLLKHVCTNGMVAMSKIFRTSLALGRGEKEVDSAVRRALASYNNEEGFHALKQRMESAGSSWASLSETYKVLELMHKATTHKSLGKDRDDEKALFGAFRKLTGDMAGHYGVAHSADFSKKKMRSLPTKCSMFQLINFMSEVATHHCRGQDKNAWQRRFQAGIGDFVSQEYDLENTLDMYPDFEDWFNRPEITN